MSLEDFARRGQAAQQTVDLLLATCLCDHLRAEHGREDPAQPGCRRCGCDRFVKGKRVP